MMTDWSFAPVSSFAGKIHVEIKYVLSKAHLRIGWCGSVLGYVPTRDLMLAKPTWVSRCGLMPITDRNSDLMDSPNAPNGFAI